MLTKLTPHQISQIDVCSVNWTRICLNTDPIDRPRAKAAIELTYECAGMLGPTRFIWFQSPLALRVCAGMICARSAVREVSDDVYGDVYCALEDSVVYEVHDLVNSAVYDLFEQIYNPVIDAITTEIVVVTESIWGGISDSLWESGFGDLWDRFEPSGRDYLWALMLWLDESLAGTLRFFPRSVRSQDRDR